MYFANMTWVPYLIIFHQYKCNSLLYFTINDKEDYFVKIDRQRKFLKTSEDLSFKTYPVPKFLYIEIVKPLMRNRKQGQCDKTFFLCDLRIFVIG
jgi:hypothetical protein